MRHPGLCGGLKGVDVRSLLCEGGSRPAFQWRENSLARSWIMEQLEIIDLGDAMTETRCSLTVGPQFDFVYGPGHWRC